MSVWEQFACRIWGNCRSWWPLHGLTGKLLKNKILAQGHTLQIHFPRHAADHGAGNRRNGALRKGL